MKIFIAGGTGLIGTQLTNQLLVKGHEVTILSRNKEKISKKWENKVQGVQGNVLTSGEWQASVDGHDAVVNLVGEHIFKKRWTRKRKQKLTDSRAISSQNLQSASINSKKKPSVFVGISGIDYYPTDMKKEFSEQDGPGEHFLGKLSEQWEAGISNLKNDGIRGVVLRFGAGFTKSGHAAELMFLPHKFFIGGWVGSGKQPFSWIHIEDMVGSIIWSIENQVEGVFNAAAPEQITFKETAKIGGKVMGRWTWTWMPGFILKIVLGERASVLLKGRYVSVDKIQNAGYEFKFPKLKEALEDIL